MHRSVVVAGHSSVHLDTVRGRRDHAWMILALCLDVRVWMLALVELLSGHWHVEKLAHAIVAHQRVGSRLLRLLRHVRNAKVYHNRSNLHRSVHGRIRIHILPVGSSIMSHTLKGWEVELEIPELEEVAELIVWSGYYGRPSCGRGLVHLV